MISSSTRAIFRPQLIRIAQSTAIRPGLGAAANTPQPFLRLRKAQFSVDSSATPTFSSYEYPTRTEAPEITTTKASDAVGSTTTKVNGSNKIYAKEDPFDDSESLSEGDRKIFKEEQSKTIGSIKLSSLPITTTVPDFIPPNVSSGELEAPETLITTLDNGIRVVSQETYSQMCTIGVLTNVGSRHESVTGTVRSRTNVDRDTENQKTKITSSAIRNFCSPRNLNFIFCPLSIFI